MNNGLQAIVFDCDGVILESADIKSRAIFKLGEPFGPEIQRRFYEHHLRHTGVSRYEKFAWLYRTELGREISPEESTRLGHLFAGYCGEAVRQAPFVPGFEAVLAECQGRLPLFVASGTPHEELCQILAERGLRDKFTAIFGAPPAKSELLSRIISGNGLRADRVLMVGDGETDLQAAHDNGTLFYGRGELFKDRGLPWSLDLTGLGKYWRGLV
ncbi:MAG: HAD hydrolase-like protein [Candidatus Adiutrix sp.]|jgi:phosphoglycolate phosphatase-like HAD superfamily hydrolase|nr:HAD hydrolase-like protein [Candidatus Adiutrix sp.]